MELASASTPESIAPPRVLVVDDDATLARALSGLLRRLHADPIVVGTVAEALAHEARFECGLIVDHQLPDGTGIDLLARLRAEGVDGPALLLTGHASVALASAAAGYGAAFCAKPASSAPIARVVEAVRRSAKGALESAPAAARPTVLFAGSAAPDALSLVSGNDGSAGLDLVRVEDATDARRCLEQMAAAVGALVVACPRNDVVHLETIALARRVGPTMPIAFLTTTRDASIHRAVVAERGRYVYGEEAWRAAVRLTLRRARIDTGPLLARLAIDHSLTAQHAELLGLVLGGFDRDDVAMYLGITPRGVRYHFDEIRQRLGLTRFEEVLEEITLIALAR